MHQMGIGLQPNLGLMRSATPRAAAASHARKPLDDSTTPLRADELRVTDPRSGARRLRRFNTRWMEIFITPGARGEEYDEVGGGHPNNRAAEYDALSDRYARFLIGPRYQMNHVWGEGPHSDNHGGAIMPDILRWIWMDYPK